MNGFMQTAQQHVGNISAGVTGAGLGGFLAAYEPHMKLVLFIVTVAAGITTVVANWKRIRAKKPD